MLQRRRAVCAAASALCRSLAGLGTSSAYLPFPIPVQLPSRIQHVQAEAAKAFFQSESSRRLSPSRTPHDCWRGRKQSNVPRSQHLGAESSKQDGEPGSTAVAAPPRAAGLRPAVQRDVRREGVVGRQSRSLAPAEYTAAIQERGYAGARTPHAQKQGNDRRHPSPGREASSPNEAATSDAGRQIGIALGSLEGAEWMEAPSEQPQPGASRPADRQPSRGASEQRRARQPREAGFRSAQRGASKEKSHVSYGARRQTKPNLVAIAGRFLMVVRGNDVESAHSLLLELLAGGGTQSSAYISRLINMYGRQRNMVKCLELFELGKSLSEGNAAEDGALYSAVLTACARAQHPPYKLPPEYALLAREVMDAALAAGVKVQQHMWGSLLNAQAKAGFIDEAFATFEELQREPHLHVPNTILCNTLLTACSRTEPPSTSKAARVVEQIMPRHGIVPDRITWNVLLATYGHARDQDGAYRVWQRFKASGIHPNHITEFCLAAAFSPCPSFAADLVAEARAMREAMSPEDSRQAEIGLDDVKPLAFGYKQLKQVQLGGGLGDAPLRDDMWCLDLHSMSAATSRITLLKRLDSVTEHVVRHGLPEMWHQRAFKGLVIITGKGNNSVLATGGVLKRVATEMLESKGVPFLSSEQGQITNAGVLLVRAKPLLLWAKQQHESSQRSAYVHQMSLRGMGLAAVLGTGVIASYLVPKILEHY